MTAKEFFTNYKRMCESYETCYDECPLGSWSNFRGEIPCRCAVYSKADEAISKVEAWANAMHPTFASASGVNIYTNNFTNTTAKANPLTTYRTKLLEHFPQADITQICRCEIYGGDCGLADEDCGTCWDMEVAE